MAVSSVTKSTAIEMKIGLDNDEPVKRRFGKLNVYVSNDDLFALGRVRNLYYRMDVRDALTNTMLVGSINLCEYCGENFGAITQQKISKERTVTEFSFEQ